MVAKQAKKLAFIGVIYAFSFVVSACDVNDSANDSPWRTVTAAREYVLGEHTSLTIVNGHPAISYYDVAYQVLKYVRATDADGSCWSSPITIDSYHVSINTTSLVLVNGCPAISYDSDNSLKYVRAKDANGSSWGSPIIVDSGGAVSKPFSLSVVKGYPAISYNYEHDRLHCIKYVRANDADGSSWGCPLIVVRRAADKNISLAVVNGCPAIVYYRRMGTDFGLKYVRASDAGGTSWGKPVTLDIHECGWSSLAVVNGYPAVGYSRWKWLGNDRYGIPQRSKVIRYVCAEDANGSSWEKPITVADGSAFSSLEVVDGYPAISYWSVGSLEYIRATDVDGSSWGSPITVAGHSAFSSLEAVNGYPAITYCKGALLKFAILTERGNRQ